jgi:hypothetical protein
LEDRVRVDVVGHLAVDPVGRDELDVACLVEAGGSVLVGLRVEVALRQEAVVAAGGPWIEGDRDVLVDVGVVLGVVDADGGQRERPVALDAQQGDVVGVGGLVVDHPGDGAVLDREPVLARPGQDARCRGARGDALGSVGEDVAVVAADRVTARLRLVERLHVVPVVDRVQASPLAGIEHAGLLLGSVAHAVGVDRADGADRGAEQREPGDRRDEGGQAGDDEPRPRDLLHGSPGDREGR